MSAAAANLLAEIAARMRADLVALKLATPLEQLRELPRPAVGDFRLALSRSTDLALIAECKHRSPSAGELRADYDPVRLARDYQEAGAAAISCLTNAPYFGGKLTHLEAVARAVSLPVLRKDFVVDAYQVWEARAAGAAALLLIVALLGDAALVALLATCAEAGLDALVEVRDRAEMRRAQQAGATIIGVNNRDLRDFSVDPQRTLRLAADKEPGSLLVAESGFDSPASLAPLQAAAVDAVLVGTALVRAPEPGAAARALVEAGRAK